MLHHKFYSAAKLLLASVLFTATTWQAATALTFALPAPGNDLVGSMFTIAAQKNDTIDAIAARYDVGFFDVFDANPHLNPDHIPFGTKVLIPGQYVLPPQRNGIVINVAEMRLYYFPAGRNEVFTYPVGIGRQGEITPVGNYYILQKIKNPPWDAPQVVRDSYLKKGIVIPPIVPSGPANPLGYYAMRLNNWSYLIHGTNEPESVGKRASAGCVHLYPGDIEHIFPLIPKKTPVHIVNQFYKIGWQNGQLYFAAIKPLSEQKQIVATTVTPMEKLLQNIANKHHARINWTLVNQLVAKKTGIPTVVSL